MFSNLVKLCNKKFLNVADKLSYYENQSPANKKLSCLGFETQNW